MSLYDEFLDKKSEDKNKKNSIDSIDQEREEEQRKNFLKMVDGRQDEISEDQKKEEEIFRKEEKLPPIPPAPAKNQKMWTRILVICLIIATSLFLSAFSWYWVIKTPRIITEQIIEEVEVVRIVPEVEPAFSFFSYDEFRDIPITREREVEVYLKQHLSDNYENDHLIKLSIRDYRDDFEPEYISLKSFFEALRITPPSGMYDKIIDEDFNLFIYSGEQNDIGFAFPVKRESMTEFLGLILANWDETMERDLQNFYSLVSPRGGEVAAPSTIYRRANIRCKGFRSAHHACFAPLDDIFIITTSLESARAVVDRSR